ETDRNESLQEEVRQLRGVVAGRKPRSFVSGYADVGFFVAQGDGSGFIEDLGPPAARFFPQYARQFRWVFPGEHPVAPLGARTACAGGPRANPCRPPSTRAASPRISATRPGSIGWI